MSYLTLLDGNVLISLSMLSIQLAVCTIRKADWKNGGLTQQVRGLRRNRPALRNNSPVRRICFICTSVIDLGGHTLAYTIDDGHGGKVHVNVCILLLISVHF